MGMSDTMKTLILIATVNVISAYSTDESRSSSDCVGPWRPVFKPSQPETGGNDIHGFAASGKSLRSDDRDVSREITHVFVPVTKPNAYRLEHKLADVNHPGYDTSVQDFVSRGKHTLQWDHYGDTGNHEDGQDTRPEHDDGDLSDGYATHNNTHHVGHADADGYGQGDGGSEGNAEDEKFFNSGSFFDEHTEAPPHDTDDFSEENFHESVPSSEDNKENNQNYEGGREKRPTATSYASIISVYNRYNDKAHPHEHVGDRVTVHDDREPYKSVWTHYQGPAEYLPNVEGNGDYYEEYGPESEHNGNGVHVYNHIPPSNPNRPIKQYRVHETPEEDEVEPPVFDQPMNILYSQPVLNEHKFNGFWRKDSRSMEELRPPPPLHFPSMSTSLFYKKPPRMINSRVFNNKQNVRKPFSYVYVLKTVNTKPNKKL